MWNTSIANDRNEQTCPFCGLACDDLIIEPKPGTTPRVANGCARARHLFGEAFAATQTQPRIGGTPAPLDAVLDHCAGLLRQARAPLFAGLATDVNGMRATLALADLCGAQLDHVNGDALFRNLLVLQDSGWLTTTLTEVRNRADLVVVVGSRCFEGFPRLVERVFCPPDALFAPPRQRQVVLAGPWSGRPLPAGIPPENLTVLEVAPGQLAGFAGMLRGLIAGRVVDTQALAGVDGGQVQALAERLRAARYSVLAWSAAEFDFPHAELTVQGLVEVVRDLNETTRAAALPLAGTLGDVTANQVCTWQTGYPLRTDLQQGFPRYDPALNRHQDLLARGESDLLLWLSAISPSALPPPADVPTIVLGHPAMTLDRPPDAFVPVGIPGVDHPGHFYRTDAACPLPLGKLRESGLPPVARIMGLLGERLRDADAAGNDARC